MELGRYLEIDGQPEVRFERTYPHPVERVWAAISDPAELAHWFPSSVEIEPRAGGTMRFFDDPYAEGATGTVLAYDPPRRLAFTWRDDELRFDLEPVEPGSCRLVLTNLLSERDTAARNASGWTICLGELAKVVDGKPGDGAHSEANMSGFQPIFDAHVAAGLPSGAAVPDPRR